MKQLLKNHSPQPIDGLAEYSVLIPLVEVNGDWHVLYQVRSQHISQPGEVSFPGGKREKDESFQDAAIRETCEELLIEKEQLEIWGEIDYILYPKRMIRCFVAQLTVSDWTSITPNPHEVERLFTIPLNILFETDPTYYPLTYTAQTNPDFPIPPLPNQESYRFNHFKRDIPFYFLQEECIWGITALFTHSLTSLLQTNKKTP